MACQSKKGSTSFNKRAFKRNISSRLLFKLRWMRDVDFIGINGSRSEKREVKNMFLEKVILPAIRG